MFLTAASAFEVLAAITIGEKAYSIAKNIPVLASLLRATNELNSEHNEIYQLFISHLKEIYEIKNNGDLPPFVKPIDETLSDTIKISGWFTPKLLDENLMINHQGKLGQRILLIDSNIINRQILKTYDLISDKSGFANVLLGYLYYFTNYELALMTGHTEEIKHINKVIQKINLILDDQEIIQKCLLNSDSTLHKNLQNIINLLESQVKPKLQKQINRETTKEKLDKTAYSFHLVTYSLLNSILLITEGNVNFHLSMDPSLIKDGVLQTSAQYRWFTSDQAYNLNPENPLKKFLMVAYGALNQINQDTRSYSKLDIRLPDISEIKKYLKNYSSNVDKTFTYAIKSQKGYDGSETIYIYNDEEILNKRAAFIFNLASLALTLINNSYVIENILDLISVNNGWIFNKEETEQIQQYFHNTETNINSQLRDIQEFNQDYQQITIARKEFPTSSKELSRYLKVALISLSNYYKPQESLNYLSQGKLVNHYQLNYIKRETLRILNENLGEKDRKKTRLDDEINRYEEEIIESLYFCVNTAFNVNHELVAREHFNITNSGNFKKNSVTDSVISFYEKAYLDYNKKNPNNFRAIIGTREKLNDNETVNIIMNLINLAEKLKDAKKNQPHLALEFNIQINYLNQLKTRLSGLFIRKEKFGNELIESAPEDLEEIHYSDYLAIKEKQSETKLTRMEEALNKSAEENAKLHQIIKEHIQELAKVNNQNKEIQEHIQQMTQSLQESESKIAEHVSAREVLEQSLDFLIDTQNQNIDNFQKELVTFDLLSKQLQELNRNLSTSYEANSILKIYGTLNSFKERLKIKCEDLSNINKNIFINFENLKKKNILITSALRERAEQVILSYNKISENISEIVRKLEEQSELLNEATSELEKARQERILKELKEKEESEQKAAEEARKIAATEKEKVKSKSSYDSQTQERKSISLDNTTNNQLESALDKNTKPFLLSNLQMYSAYASNQWFYYFRISYRQNKCANLFKTILNDDSLLFEHRLIILNKLIEKILTSANLQKFDTAEFHDVIENIQDSSHEASNNAEYEKLNHNYMYNQKLFLYSEDLENEVDSGILYDLFFGKQKYI